MERVEKLAARTLELAAMALMMVLVVVIAYSVVGRQFFRISVPWSEEVAAGTLMWMVMLGSAAAWYHRRHLVVDLVMRRVGKRTLLVMTIFVEIASVVLLATAFIGSVSMMSVSAHNSTTALGISYSYLYLSLVIGLGSMILFSLAYLARLFIHGTSILPDYAEVPEWNT
ncbi:TRAP transporter small permease subunit [Aliihoeflea aestuarii]|jgi:TRAP-type transport system small permease protein|uniref:TRAP transporter small permease n=1 Tax=Aliihoeflea aestuarii TaxID=453840 RepID=UPI0020931BE3|nr:TRAP transporter small permease [Aliihoeflea aestuarii]MCO6389552.1 TRAP transporter small permease subunit [Aliihoeflea aestuarii]